MTLNGTYKGQNQKWFSLACRKKIVGLRRKLKSYATDIQS